MWKVRHFLPLILNHSMRTDSKSSFYVTGSICGIAGVVCYILAISLPLSPKFSFLLALAWPIFSIVFAFAIYKFVAHNYQSIYNQLAFIFVTIAFVMVSIMISVQVVVKTAMQDSISKAAASDESVLELIANSLRWVDLGVDLAWDIFLGVALLLLARAIWNHPKFGKWWSLPLAVLAAALIVLNMLTFPYPPDSQGVLDVGPFIGLFMILLGGRLVYLGRKLKMST